MKRLFRAFARILDQNPAAEIQPQLSGPALVCRDLGLEIGRKKLLHGIDLQLEPGACLAIIGKNGSGKTSLLKSFLRLNQTANQVIRTSGEIRIFGHDIKDLDQAGLARLIAWVPQAVAAPPPPCDLHGFLLLARYARLRNCRPAKADELAVERALRLTGMTGFARASLASLSGGERQKAYLAAALAQEAPILLLDEPTAFLDPAHVVEVNGLISKLQTVHGLTIVCVSHDLNWVLSTAASGGLVLAIGQEQKSGHGRCLWFGPASRMLQADLPARVYGHDFICLKDPVSGQDLVVPSQFGGKR